MPTVACPPLTVTNVRRFPDRGRRSPKYGHLGMWNLGLGPNSVIPSQRLEVVILNLEGVIVRRFEQIRGACTDPGYVDFFLSQKCRPASHQHPLVDIDEHRKCAAILCENYTEHMGFDLYLKLIREWAERHGKPEWAIPPDVQAGDVRPL